MKKVEQFIKEKTRNDGNTSRGWHNRDVSIPTTYTPWVVPNVAREAAKIARKETIKEVCKWLENNMIGYCVINDTYDVDGCIKDLKEYLENKV